MEFTKRDFKKPELTDPADIRDLNENSDSLEDHLNAITGYDYGKTIILGTDAVEINKIHLNKIPADPDFGKYFLILTGSTWDTSTKEEHNIKTNSSTESKLPKGNVSAGYDTAEKIEGKVEELKVFDSTIDTVGVDGTSVQILGNMAMCSFTKNKPTGATVTQQVVLPVGYQFVDNGTYNILHLLSGNDGKVSNYNSNTGLITIDTVFDGYASGNFMFEVLKI